MNILEKLDNYLEKKIDESEYQQQVDAEFNLRKKKKVLNKQIKKAKNTQQKETLEKQVQQIAIQIKKIVKQREAAFKAQKY